GASAAHGAGNRADRSADHLAADNRAADTAGYEAGGPWRIAARAIAIGRAAIIMVMPVPDARVRGHAHCRSASDRKSGRRHDLAEFLHVPVFLSFCFACLTRKATTCFPLPADNDEPCAAAVSRQYRNLQVNCRG